MKYAFIIILLVSWLDYKIFTANLYFLQSDLTSNTHVLNYI